MQDFDQLDENEREIIEEAIKNGGKVRRLDKGTDKLTEAIHTNLIKDGWLVDVAGELKVSSMGEHNRRESKRPPGNQ